MLILLIFFTWFFLLDIFAGLLFRIRYSLGPGTFIQTGNISGQIKSFSPTSVILLTNEGLIQSIPYSKIINEVITEEGSYGLSKENIFQVQADLSLGRAKSEELIRTSLLNAPWSNSKEEPLIRFIEGNEKGYLYEVTLFAKKKKHIKLIVESLGKISSLHISSWTGYGGDIFLKYWAIKGFFIYPEKQRHLFCTMSETLTMLLIEFQESVQRPLQIILADPV